MRICDKQLKIYGWISNEIFCEEQFLQVGFYYKKTVIMKIVTFLFIFLPPQKKKTKQKNMYI